MYSRLTVLTERARDERLKKAPLRIRHEDCIVCDACQRSCPSEFGAILNIGLGVHIVPELCTTCGYCLDVCPVACIEPDHGWAPSGDEIWSLLEPGNDPYVGSRDVAASVRR
jgi:Na+-translocating ferredoxin:NAD+ oxidoreductase subunit B